MSKILLRHSWSPPLSSAKCGDVTPLWDSHNQGDGMGLLEQWPGSSLGTHTKGQATQHGYLPSLLGDGDKGTEIVYSEEKKNFVLGRLEQPRYCRTKSPVLARQAQRTNQGKTPFICTPWVAIHLSFNSQQGPLLSSLSARDWCDSGRLQTFRNVPAAAPGIVRISQLRSFCQGRQ